MVPELATSVAGDDGRTWLEDAKRLLWSPDDFRNHQDAYGLEKMLRSESPPPLAPDTYGVRRLWPVCVEFLRPMTPKMSKAVNDVSHVLGLACDIGEGEVTDIVPIEDNANNSFVISRQAVQDKLLSPLIKALENDTLSGEREMTSPHDARSTLPGEIDTTAALDSGTKEGDARLSTSHPGLTLRQALVALRKEIVKEKDLADKGRPKKRANSMSPKSEQLTYGIEKAKGAKRRT